MKAYSHTTDASTGPLQETGGSGEQGTAWPVSVFEEYDWHQPPQFPVQFVPRVLGDAETFPPAKDAPAERWLLPRKTG